MNEITQALPWVSTGGLIGMVGVFFWVYREFRKSRREDRVAEIDATSKEDMADLVHQVDAVALIRSVMADAKKEYNEMIATLKASISYLNEQAMTRSVLHRQDVESLRKEIAEIRKQHEDCELNNRQMRYELDLLKSGRSRDDTPVPAGRPPA